jgi:hypothetical protein
MNFEGATPKVSILSSDSVIEEAGESQIGGKWQQIIRIDG